MHKSATKCNKTIGKWCKSKHGASKIIDTFETYQAAFQMRATLANILTGNCGQAGTWPCPRGEDSAQMACTAAARVLSSLCAVAKDSSSTFCSSSISFSSSSPALRSAYMENPSACPSPCPCCPPNSSQRRCLRKTSRRKRGRRLISPLLVVEGAAPPPPEMLAQLDCVAAAGLATRKRGELSSWCEPSEGIMP
jgi:hypothetical protein